MDMRTDNWSGTATRPAGLIIRQKGPNNLEMPFDQLGEFITPSELFYIRSHFPTPELDPRTNSSTFGIANRAELPLCTGHRRHHEYAAVAGAFQGSGAGP